jgi:gliding motility-associated-like protein
MKFLFVLLCCCCGKLLIAQTDTAFWFVAPEVTIAHGDRPIYLRFTALNQDAVITITQPANINFSPITVNLTANTSLSYDLTSRIDIIENKPADQILNYGLLIRSTAFITAYYEEASVNNPEIFALKGRNALGTYFFVPAQNLMSNGTNYNPPAYTAFDIVATEDNTVITITPAAPIVGHAAGTPFTIVLNRGQTYSAAATSTAAANHLMGSTVSATKPIAISIKDDSITGGGYGGCLDLAGEQIVPLSLIGTKYISLPGYLNNPANQPTDNIFVLATEDNTSVSFNGVTVTTLNKGQTYRQPSFNDIFYIETSKPVYVLHLSGFGCEVGHAQLPQLECSGSRTVGFTRSVNSPLYVNILVPNGGETNFTFNGDNTTINASQFADVPFTGGQWKYARIQLSTAQMAAGAAAIVKNSSKDFHLSIIHGDVATGCRYGYFSGFNRFDAKTLSNANNSQPGCTGDTLKLYCDVGAAEGIDFLWTGPNGFTSMLQNPVIVNMQINQSGQYKVIATKAGCSTVADSTTVVIAVKPLVTTLPFTPICEQATIQLSAATVETGASFSWLGPSNFSSNTLNNSIGNANVFNSGNYYLTTTKDGCTDKDTIVVVVKPLPSAQLSTAAPVCRLTTTAITNNNTVANASYSWIGPNGFTAATQNITINSINYSDTGKYYLSVTADGCSASDSVSLGLKEIPVIQFIPPADVCEAVNAFQIIATEKSGIAGNGIFSGNGISPNGLFTPTVAGVGRHTIQYSFTAANGCIATQQQSLEVFPNPLVDAGPNKVLIQNNSTVLNATVIGNVANLLWSPNYLLSNTTTLNPIATPLQSVTYTLAVTTAEGCFGTDTIAIKVLPNIVVPNAFSPNKDGVNDVWSIPALAAFPTCIVEVFDRSGKVVYRSSGYQTAWDGTIKGKPLPVATYYYLIQLNDNFLTTPLRGPLTILR